MTVQYPGEMRIKPTNTISLLVDGELLDMLPIWEKVCSYRFTTESLINLLIACNGTEYVRSSVTGDNKHEGGDSNGAWEKVRLRSLTRVRDQLASGSTATALPWTPDLRINAYPIRS